MFEEIINTILSNFNLAYMLSVNVLTYLIIKLIDFLNKDKAVSTFVKRLVLVLSVIAVSTIYVLLKYDNYIVLINSSIAAPVFYSWILRPILKKFKLGYKQYDETLKL